MTPEPKRRVKLALTRLVGKIAAPFERSVGGQIMTDDVKGLAAVADKLMGNSRGSIAWAGEPDGSLQNTFGDVKIRASESETFYGEPDPWVGRAACRRSSCRLRPARPRFRRLRY